VIGAMFLSFWMSMSLFYHIAYLPQAINLYQYTWMRAGIYHIDFGFYLDALSLVMAVMVTGISTLVCIYSLGYMNHEDNLNQYYACIAFFTFAMLWLIFADNLLQLFFGWEGVGVASYLLIGFFVKKKQASNASMKAFLLNRVGDLGLIVAMALFLKFRGSLGYDELLYMGRELEIPLWGLQVCDWIGLGLLLAAMAKSAQMPLNLWLPDSMVGPTPISALIHAATMVTAGVFLICRFSFLFSLSPFLQSWCLMIGLASVIFMGLVALCEYNIKRIIAYSTISQLGNMIAICALQGYVFSIFHLITHAVFKALLFLTAGAIIVAMDHEEDIRDMGGLKSHKTIHLAMICGLLSLCAIPPFAGFFSKDAILTLAKDSSLWIYTAFLMGSFVTALYSIRLYYLLFWYTKPSVVKPVSRYITSVLWVLMILSVCSGFMLIPFLPALSNTFIQSDPVDNVVVLLGDSLTFIQHGISDWSFSVTILTFMLFPIMHKRSILPYLWVIKSNYGLVYLLNGIIWLYGIISRFSVSVIEQMVDFLCVYGGGIVAVGLGKAGSHFSTGKLHHYVWIMLLSLVVLVLSVT